MTTTPATMTRAAQSAQARRTNEVMAMNSLAEALPVPRKVSKRLDKGAVLRMAIGYLKMQDILNGLKTGYYYYCYLCNKTGFVTAVINVLLFRK